MVGRFPSHLSFSPRHIENFRKYVLEVFFSVNFGKIYIKKFEKRFPKFFRTHWRVQRETVRKEGSGLAEMRELYKNWSM
jgi:hypothetical protein